MLELDVECCGPSSAVNCALVEREGVSPLFLLIMASGEPAQLLFFEYSFVSCMFIKYFKLNINLLTTL